MTDLEIVRSKILIPKGKDKNIKNVVKQTIGRMMSIVHNNPKIAALAMRSLPLKDEDIQKIKSLLKDFGKT